MVLSVSRFSRLTHFLWGHRIKNGSLTIRLIPEVVVMFFRGACIQRDEPGRCDLLPQRGLSSNRTDLSTSDGVASVRPTHRFQPRAATSQLKSTACGRRSRPKPVTCKPSEISGTSLNQPDSPTLKDWLDVISNDHLTTCSRTEPGRHIAWRDTGACEEGLAQFAREGGLCQEYIGESSQVSWRWW